MNIITSYVCHPGNKRDSNQDNLYYQGIILKNKHKKRRSKFSSKWNTKQLLCFGVFDGMGGEQYGELASCVAASITKEILSEPSGKRLPSDLLYAICSKANTEIYRKTVELGAKRIGTTAAIIMFQYDTVWCCNIGDSKIFRLRENQLEQLSMDHVAVCSEYTWKKPGLTAHLGMGPFEIFPNPYLINDKVMEGDTYLVCSDGITDMVDTMEIKTILEQNKGNVKKASKYLVKVALEHGGLDNATLILAEVLNR